MMACASELRAPARRHRTASNGWTYSATWPWRQRISDERSNTNACWKDTLHADHGSMTPTPARSLSVIIWSARLWND